MSLYSCLITELQEDMDISPTQSHPPAAKRAVFQSPLTFSPCISPLSSVPQTTIEEMRHLDSSAGEDPRIFQPSFREDSCSRPAFNTQIVQFPSYSSSYLSKGVGLSSDSTRNHQCVESAFLPFKKPCTTDCLPTHPSQNISPVNDSHFESLPAVLNPVTTIS